MKILDQCRYIHYKNNVATKEKLLPIRVTPLRKAEFKAACEMRGATMSGLLHQYIAKIVNEERMRDPDRFKEILDKTLESEKISKDAELDASYVSPVTESDVIDVDPATLPGIIKKQ